MKFLDFFYKVYKIIIKTSAFSFEIWKDLECRLLDLL